MCDEVLTEYADGFAVITINRPKARNAINSSVAEGIAAAMDELDGRQDLKVGIITGAGDVFCAGMDLKAFLRGERPYVPGRGFAGLVEAPPRKPLIAAVEGYAVAGGCELVLASDLVVAAQNARFGLPEVRRGLVAAGGGLLRLPQRIPYQVAMELALTGDFLTAERAYALGLVNRLTAPGEALAEAWRLAAAIAANGPLAVRVTKQVLVESRGWPAEAAFGRQRELIAPIFTSDDAQEGARAFAEKRAPVWVGR
ncbi:MAG TPA: crotonase/enoyl-CoA hydratase family protein [Nonomuraea sp.]|nr:crotonase/enoyl-CoA hydratase family protein [Nonomuraea sp.]